MLSTDVQKKLIAETINSAVCIDNEYVEAYTDGGEGRRDDSRLLYESFRDSGTCHLDIYHFTNIDAYHQNKKTLLRNRDLVILDWELDDNKVCKYEDALAILDDVCQNDHIHFVDIYTQADDHIEIAQTIYSYFKLQKREELLPHVEAVVEPMKEIFDGFELEDFDAKVVENIANDLLRDFIMNPTRRERILHDFITRMMDVYEKAGGKGNFKAEVCKTFNNAMKQKKDQFKDMLAYIRAYCICYICNSEKVSQTGLMAKAVNPTTILVNGTIVHVTSKNTINASELFPDLVNAIIGIPKHRSLLLSLMLKNVVGCNLATVGKSLGKISEEALLAHCKSLKEVGVEEENISNFVVSALIEHVLYSFHSEESEISFVDMMALGEGEVVTPSEKEDVLSFNSMLTFIPRKAIKAARHQIRTGDVFKLDKVVEGIDDQNKTHQYQYVMCITQSCDALRPEKVIHNLAFAFGESFDGKEMIDKAETDFFTYFPDNVVVKWSKRFFTIYVADTKLTLGQEEGKFSFHYIDGYFTATFLGTQKESYTYRIINNVFSNAMRIGIDLPHK